jgi:hypothetical protein
VFRRVRQRYGIPCRLAADDEITLGRPTSPFCGASTTVSATVQRRSPGGGRHRGHLRITSATVLSRLPPAVVSRPLLSARSAWNGALVITPRQRVLGFDHDFGVVTCRPAGIDNALITLEYQLRQQVRPRDGASDRFGNLVATAHWLRSRPRWEHR